MCQSCGPVTPNRRALVLGAPRRGRVQQPITNVPRGCWSNGVLPPHYGQGRPPRSPTGGLKPNPLLDGAAVDDDSALYETYVVNSAAVLRMVGGRRLRRPGNDVGAAAWGTTQGARVGPTGMGMQRYSQKHAPPAGHGAIGVGEPGSGRRPVSVTAVAPVGVELIAGGLAAAQRPVAQAVPD